MHDPLMLLALRVMYTLVLSVLAKLVYALEAVN